MQQHDGGELVHEFTSFHDSNRTGGVGSSIFNLANAALGAGILAFPYAFKSCGLLLGVIITCVLVSLAAFTLHIVSYIAYQNRCNSYQEVIFSAFGRKGQLFSEFILLSYLTGACVVYLTVIGDCAQPAIVYYTNLFIEDAQDAIYTDRKFIISVLGALFVFPLCLLRKINKLGFTSILAILGCIYMVIFVMVKAFLYIHTQGMPDSIQLFVNPALHAGVIPEIFMAFPLIAFAFQCHVLMVPIFGELKRPSMLKADIIIGSSLTLCTVLYVLVGVFGYLTFGALTADDILLSYNHSDPLANLGRLAIGLTATFSFPITNFTCRLTIRSLFFKNKPFSDAQHYIVSTLFFIFCLLVALFVPGVGIAFGICGSLGATMLMFGFPALMMLKFGRKSPRFKYVWIPLSVFFMLLSIVMSVCGFSVTMIKIFVPEE